MNCIYIYDGYFEKGEKGWPMIRAAAERYGMELRLNFDFAGAEIQRSSKGKPFFTGAPIDFSLSHSGMMWMCMFSETTCGLDLQQVEEKRNYETIVRRRYTEEEQHYVKLWGKEGFYDIWVRKEAFGKCTGLGIFSAMPSMVDEQTELKPVLEWQGITYYMEAIEISPEMKCAVCMTEKDTIELRVLG